MGRPWRAALLSPLWAAFELSCGRTLYANMLCGALTFAKPLCAAHPLAPGGILADEMGLGKTARAPAALPCGLPRPPSGLQPPVRCTGPAGSVP